VNSSTYEVFLGGGEIGASKWHDFLAAVSKYLRLGDRWKVTALLDGVSLRYYLETPRPLPSDLGVSDFLIKPTSINYADQDLQPGILHFYHQGDDCLDLIRRLASRSCKFRRVSFEFRSYYKKYTSSAYLVYDHSSKTYLEKLTCRKPTEILAADFSKNKSYTFKKFPKYLKSDKLLKLLQDDSTDALFEVDNFPYREQKQFLSQSSYDFEKHSLVLGGSGSGKSKFLASFIDHTYQAAADQYKIVVIDPHDSLKHDCEQIASRRVIDFCSVENSINLFQNQAEDVNVSVELSLTLFRSLMGADYNTQLERVLRYASYLLMSIGQFSFLKLRRLLTDLEYCNQVTKQFSDQLPDAVTRFFLADFGELRTKSYAVAIAPIIAFIDEMQMVPVFNQDANLPSLADNIHNNFLSIYSLSRPKLGYKVVQTIAGLLLQQLFLFAERGAISEHLIVIIDEVATIENPILARFLSELRKFRTSLILAGQYFDQFSPELRDAIFANTSNYYVFRVSKRDAELLVKNLSIKLAGSDKLEDQQNLLTSLKDRECLVQVSKTGESYPAGKARTLDFSPAESVPENHSEPEPPVASVPSSDDSVLQSSQSHAFDFSLGDTKIKPEDIMRSTSTSRKIIKGTDA